ncbi:uncharacterized protein LOC125838027 [Solanum verrucosum]|uniref:uncharacterized protein LOC125838027 n=1 Tax=Solanum verrucosum TaxID=315347 RepID=UPI0020D03030|nr:uncharacterized protein LOC125838027 [Solanum verrucosum]
MRNCPRINEIDGKFLEAPFEAEEILESIKACAGDKAPGPDGYTMAFFSQCWDIIRHELVAAVQNFHARECFEKSFNATFVALIPKKVGEIELNDFRPISLVGGVYKIISKLLAERLKKVIHRIVDIQQMAFIKGRQILDAMVIANELVDSRVKSKQPGIICKLDIQKAYDHVNWNYLVNMLQKMGFGSKWIRWIKYCIGTVKFSILINRSPTGFFSSQRGLRQGDPLSPFLFILAMEGMRSLINTTKAKDWIREFQVQNRATPAGVIDRIKVLRRTFFWQGNEDKMKYHLVKYEEMNISKKIGGVSIRNMKFQNQSLMMKWLWKFASAVNSLWKEVIAAKYGMSDKWMTTKKCGVLDGQIVWSGPIKPKGWNLHFRRNLNDWEMCRITEFLVTLAQFSNLSKEEDSLVWNVGNKGCFTVNSAYEDLNAVGFEEVEWPWKMIWKTKIPYKVNCFTWLLAKETVLTHENLSKRGVHLCSRKKGGEMEDGPIMYMVDSMAREEPEMS